MSKVLRSRGTKVIKDNDGVAVVEGTPAASLVKDVDKFFATKPPERMAGESISQPRKLDPNNINLRGITKKAPGRDESKPRPEDGGFGGTINKRLRSSTRESRPRPEDGGFGGTINKRREEQMDDTPKRSVEEPNLRRSEAKEKAESRRKRFFERRRSRREAERSQTEQEATQGKFITTLGR
jgi:hypothetical protein